MANWMWGMMLVVSVLLGGCGREPEPREIPHKAPVSANTAVVEKGMIPIPYDAVGTVQSKASSVIQSMMTGHITAIHVKEGDAVETGALLVEIDNREALAQAQKAQSALDEAQRALETVEKSASAAQQAQAAAAAKKELARTDLERVKQLVSQNAASRQKLDEAEAQFKAASASHQEASDTAGSYLSKKAEVTARIEQAKAEIENVQVALSYAQVKAPISGIVTHKAADVGDLASPGVVLLELEDSQSYRLEALVDEAQVHRVHMGDPVPVTLDALGSEPLKGTVGQILPSAEQNTRTFIVKVDLPSNGSLRSGMFGRARFSAGEKSALLLPSPAVVVRGQLTGVYAVGADNIARWRLITAGKTFDGKTEVLSGLNAGETVAVEPLDAVSDGTPIQR